MTIRHATLTLVLACLATATACSSGDTSSPPASVPPTPATPASIGVTSSAGRDMLTDKAGKSLYVFAKDTPGTSACVGECLTKWPALPGPVIAGPGVTAGLITTLTRPDGTTQAAYAGKPLYYFAADSAPGDTRGQGLMGAWHLIAPDGQPVP
ncbi:hypothetical protein ACFRAQ_12590 [Nocardia sp. NPDC056611]|uniref:COG4315 family predicted lipoprotein n=1 Tax=Nocardia sp. NPDC056611 TaxID=3345877 RepID=UPI00366C3F30